MLMESPAMDKAVFERNFRNATEHAVAFAKNYVVNDLPDGRVFLVYTNQSYDGHPLRSDETLYPEEELPAGSDPSLRTQRESIDFLWRHGKVPEWIDVSVTRVEAGNTVLSLLCCGRFTADERLLYYPQSPTPGFGIKSPVFPPRWIPSERSPKFDLHWNIRRP
jgi:hypothetical protein